MKKYSSILYVLGMILGFSLLLAAAIISYGFNIDSMDKYLGIMIGYGCGIGSVSSGSYYFYKKYKKNPEFKKKLDIQINDERNILIKGKTAIRVNSMMIYMISIIVILFVIMDVQSFVIIILSALLVIQLILNMFFFNYYEKKL